jgi:hypothetical protein
MDFTKIMRRIGKRFLIFYKNMVPYVALKSTRPASVCNCEKIIKNLVGGSKRKVDGNENKEGGIAIGCHQ